MGDLEGAPAVHFNLHLLSFYLYATFKSGIGAAGEPFPSEKGRFGDWLQQHQLQQTSALAVALRQKGSVLSKVGYSIPPVNPTYFEILSS